MFSVAAAATLRCTNVNTKTWDKAEYMSRYTPLVDIAIGIILCIVGSLASHGVFAMTGAAWLTGIGSVQIILAVVISCCRSPLCKTGYHWVGERIRQRREAQQNGNQ